MKKDTDELLRLVGTIMSISSRLSFVELKQYNLKLHLARGALQPGALKMHTKQTRLHTEAETEL